MAHNILRFKVCNVLLMLACLFLLSPYRTAHSSPLQRSSVQRVVGISNVTVTSQSGCNVGTIAYVSWSWPGHEKDAVDFLIAGRKLTSRPWTRGPLFAFSIPHNLEQRDYVLTVRSALNPTLQASGRICSSHPVTMPARAAIPPQAKGQAASPSKTPASSPARPLPSSPTPQTGTASSGAPQGAANSGVSTPPPQSTPTESTGSCCHPKISFVNESGVHAVRCLDKLTEQKCKQLQGNWAISKACSDLNEETCGSFGACCYIDPASGQAKCANNMLEGACKTVNGTFSPNKECSQVTCTTPEAPKGSCCHPKISYVNENGVQAVRCLDNLTEYKCKQLQGTWAISKACADLNEATCGSFGACCYIDPANGQAKCAKDMLAGACSTLNGTFSPNKDCSQVTCNSPTGSCCHPKISFVNESGVHAVRCLDKLTEQKCKQLQGNWAISKACAALDESTCGSFGACCYIDPANGQAKCANNMLEGACKTVNGTFSPNKECSASGCVTGQ